MSAAPLLGAWACYRRYNGGNRWLAPGAGAVTAVALVVSPWFIRNYETFHRVIPFRSCLGLELYCGNNQDSWHWGPPGYHPSDNESEWREYQQLGEAAYTHKKFDEGLAFIRSHRRFVRSAKLASRGLLVDGILEFQPALSGRRAGRSGEHGCSQPGSRS